MEASLQLLRAGKLNINLAIRGIPVAVEIETAAALPL